MTSQGESPRRWEIEPNGRLGPLELGSTRETVVDVLGEPMEARQSQPLEFLEYGDLTLMLHSGVVSMIVADSAYGGTTRQGLGPGLGVQEAECRVGPLWYDEEESLWRFAGGQHIAVEIVRPPRAGEVPIDGESVAEAYVLSEPSAATIRRVYLVTSVADGPGSPRCGITDG